MTAPAVSLNLYEQSVLQDLDLTASELESLLSRMDKDVVGESLPMSTAAIADAYRHAHYAEKYASEAKGRIRVELLARLGAGKEDAKGTVAFQGSTARIEARPRTAAKMDEAAMTALLQTRGLYDEATDETVAVNVAGLLDAMRMVTDFLDSKGLDTAARMLNNALTANLTITKTVNEKKVEKLAKAGKLDPQEAAACYTTTTTYALYDVTQGSTP